MANEDTGWPHLMGQLYSSRNALRRVIAQLDADTRNAAIISMSEEAVLLQQQLEGLADDEARAFVNGALEENRRISVLMQ
ncbi:hypothetical protein [Brucella sp. NBRC 12953]|uniref:hypothetical protein n=1 Tax=Brucella sp. NBRC 12953 TaxID=3075481 RepID=UPI00333F2284